MNEAKLDNADVCAEGILPAHAPLANPYVPYQQLNPPKYTAKKGLVRGTLFPGLDLPFMGMVNKHELPDTPMHELQALDFAISDLGLYLDTHTEDREALDLFREYVTLYRQGVMQYEKLYGPLKSAHAGAGSRYEWLKDPWPWDLAQNEEA